MIKLYMRYTLSFKNVLKACLFTAYHSDFDFRKRLTLSPSAQTKPELRHEIVPI